MAKNTLLVLLSILAGTAVCELLVRQIAGQTLPTSDLYVIDHEVGKRMRPNWLGQEFGVEVKTNSLGLRNPETTFAKPPDRYRILALGDSWTYGYRAAEANTYPRQLEFLLNQRAVSRGTPPRYEIINAGVVGYSTGQEATYLQVEGYRFNPDLILVAYYPVNDTDNKREKYQRYNRLRSIHPWVLELYLLLRDLRSLQYLRGVKQSIRDRLEGVYNQASWSHETESGGLAELSARLVLDHWTQAYRDGESGWEDAKDALREIGQMAGQINANGLVVLLPDLEDLNLYVTRDHPKIEGIVRQAVVDADLDYYDLLGDFTPYRERQTEIRDLGYRHPNAAGYRVIAEALAEQIERRYLGIGGSTEPSL